MGIGCQKQTALLPTSDQVGLYKAQDYSLAGRLYTAVINLAVDEVETSRANAHGAGLGVVVKVLLVDVASHSPHAVDKTSILTVV